ncbi:MAG: hypothetical protein QXT14_06890 [Candidatus Bathyarchaeia archaeon]
MTSKVAMKRMSRACELLSTTPKDMTVKAKNNIKEFKDSLEDAVARLEADWKSIGYTV